MFADDLESLPLAQRLALSYAPARSREAILMLMLLDNRLAAVLKQRGENVLIAQMKLAWWRDRLGQSPAEWPKGEPLLACLKDWPGDVKALIALVDGWEELLREELDRRALVGFTRGRAQAWATLANGIESRSLLADVESAVREWALFDLAQHVGAGEEREVVLEQAHKASWERRRLARDLRPIAVLHGLARRALQRGSMEMLDGPGAMFTALQLGLLGR